MESMARTRIRLRKVIREILGRGITIRKHDRVDLLLMAEDEDLSSILERLRVALEHRFDIDIEKNEWNHLTRWRYDGGATLQDIAEFMHDLIHQDERGKNPPSSDSATPGKAHSQTSVKVSAGTRYVVRNEVRNCIRFIRGLGGSYLLPLRLDLTDYLGFTDGDWADLRELIEERLNIVIDRSTWSNVSALGTVIAVVRFTEALVEQKNEDHKEQQKSAFENEILKELPMKAATENIYQTEKGLLMAKKEVNYAQNPTHMAGKSPNDTRAIEEVAVPTIPYGYGDLWHVLVAAFDQAASGKGRERHVSSDFQGFMDQPIMRIPMSKEFLTGLGGLSYQVEKKSGESDRMVHRALTTSVDDKGVVQLLEAAQREVLGSIIYSAAKFLYIKKAIEDQYAEDEF